MQDDEFREYIPVPGLRRAFRQWILEQEEEEKKSQTAPAKRSPRAGVIETTERNKSPTRPKRVVSGQGVGRKVEGDEDVVSPRSPREKKIEADKVSPIVRPKRTVRSQDAQNEGEREKSKSPVSRPKRTTKNISGDLREAKSEEKESPRSNSPSPRAKPNLSSPRDLFMSQASREDLLGSRVRPNVNLEKKNADFRIGSTRKQEEGRLKGWTLTETENGILINNDMSIGEISNGKSSFIHDF